MFCVYFFQRERAVPNPLRARSPGSQLELAKCHVQGFFLFFAIHCFFDCARRSGSQLELAKIHVQKRRRWRRTKDRPMEEEEEEEEEFIFNDTISEGPRAPAVESLGFRV